MMGRVGRLSSRLLSMSAKSSHVGVSVASLQLSSYPAPLHVRYCHFPDSHCTACSCSSTSEVISTELFSQIFALEFPKYKEVPPAVPFSHVKSRLSCWFSVLTTSGQSAAATAKYLKGKMDGKWMENGGKMEGEAPWLWRGG